MEKGISPAAASRMASGHPYLIYKLRKGSKPNYETLRGLCTALDLEFYIGRRREDGPPTAVQPSETPPSEIRDNPLAAPAEATPEDTAAVAGVSEAMRDQMASILKVEAQAIRREVCEGISQHLHSLQDETIPRLMRHTQSLEDTGALAVRAANDGDDVPGTRSVRMIEMEAAAGGGAYNLNDAPVRGPVWFRRDWIDSRGINPTQAILISVRGDSMEPTLPAGCKILVDRQRRRRRVGHIYVITTPDGLVVKRMGKDEDGGWRLVSDSKSPDWPDMPWPDDAVVAGEVKWMAREFS